MDFVRNSYVPPDALVHQGAPIQRNIDGRAAGGIAAQLGGQPESARPALAQGVSETFKMPSGTQQMIFDALTRQRSS
jgi:hypothetical protein